MAFILWEYKISNNYSETTLSRVTFTLDWTDCMLQVCAIQFDQFFHAGG